MQPAVLFINSNINELGFCFLRNIFFTLSWLKRLQNCDLSKHKKNWLMRPSPQLFNNTGDSLCSPLSYDDA